MATITNTSYSNRKLVVAYPENFNVQSAFDTPIDTAKINKRQPQTQPVFHVRQTNREEIRDCTGEFILKELITDEVARFTLAWDATALFAAGYLAYAFGVAAAPTGTPADEVQTLTSDATGGTFTLEFDFEGIGEETGNLAFDITAADLQTALENLRSIKPGNVTVSGTLGAGFVITFVNDLAKANLPLIVLDATNLTGATSSTLVETTPGENNLHLLTRTTSDFPVLFSLIEGFEGETNGIKKYSNLVLDSYTLTVTRRGRLTLEVVAFGSPEGEVLTGYSIPACDNIDPILAKNVRLSVGGDWVTNDLVEASYTYSNNIPIDEFAFAFDSIEPLQLKSGDKTSEYTFQFTGSPTSQLYAAAEGNSDENFQEIKLFCGIPGERLTIISPSAQVLLAEDAQIAFVGGTGGRSLSAFNLTARPSPDGSQVIDRAEYNGAHTTQFLTV